MITTLHKYCAKNILLFSAILCFNFVTINPIVATFWHVHSLIFKVQLRLNVSKSSHAICAFPCDFFITLETLIPVVEFKEFEWWFKFKPRFKYGWFHLKFVSNVSRFKPALHLNQVLADLNRGLNSLNSISDCFDFWIIKILQNYFLLPLKT